MDATAKRYGKFPHEVLELPPEKYRLAIGIALRGYEAEAEAVEDAKKEAARKDGKKRY